MIYWILLIVVLYLLISIENSPKNKGKIGENKVNNKLNKLNNEYKVLNDILLPLGNNTIQIDHVVVSPYGLFIIETKNYNGKIYGNESDRYWVQKLNKGKNIYKIYNPIKQNNVHISAVKKTLQRRNLNCISIIVFTGDAQLLVNYTEKARIITLDELLPVIKSYKTKYYDEFTVNLFYKKIKEANIYDKKIRKQHIKKIKKKYKY